MPIPSYSVALYINYITSNNNTQFVKEELQDVAYVSII